MPNQKIDIEYNHALQPLETVLAGVNWSSATRIARS